MIRKKGKFKIAVFLTVVSVFAQCMFAAATEDEQPATGPDWAIDEENAPSVVAESAIVMDIDTGVTLYEKNIHKREYPASITKLLTCLVAAENSEPTEIVTFSTEAVFGIERGSSNIGIDVGQQLTMEECYYGALLASANEVASGIAEHVGGSIEGFTAMMNEKVKELGGEDSNFVNANGLHDDNHYTSAYDMALIGQAFAKNEMLLGISATVYYYLAPTEMQPDEIELRNHHRMLPGCQLSRTHPYEYMIGGKNGYTTVSQSTLVTFAKKDGHRLVCVVLKDKNPSHYTDTIALFNYGFACYEDSSVRALIDAKMMELQAEEDAAEEEAGGSGAEDTGSGENSAGQLMTEGQNGRTGSDGEQWQVKPDDANSGETGYADEGGSDKAEKEKSGGISVLTIIVIIVVLAAAGLCGFIFYRSYKQEQERARRRAEIMARHRARRNDDG